MQLEITVVDAFTDELFKGNSAAIIITDSWLADELMQSIATENNLSETAFLVLDGAADTYHIRWFSPLTEIDFCGHATLASAYVLFHKHPDLKTIRLSAKAIGMMRVIQTGDGKIQMDFPNTKPSKCNNVPESLLAGLSIAPAQVYKNAQAYFVIYHSQSDVLDVTCDNDQLMQLAPFDVVVTCQAQSKPFKDFDFISRYFWPANGGDEDPVTGSIHTGLASLWAERLKKHELIAYQASKRGGVVYCEVASDRVLISGKVVQYLTGFITVDE